jgi:hypothetical protein
LKKFKSLFAISKIFGTGMAEDGEDVQLTQGDQSIEAANKNKRYRKPKPWDTDDIDHVPSPLLPCSAFGC